MKCLQILELKVDDDSDFEIFFLYTGQLQELAITSNSHHYFIQCISKNF